jgi:hypothetical protein
MCKFDISDFAEIFNKLVQSRNLDFFCVVTEKECVCVKAVCAVLLVLCLLEFGEILHKVVVLSLFIVDTAAPLLETTALHPVLAEAIQAVSHYLIRVQPEAGHFICFHQFNFHRVITATSVILKPTQTTN